MAYRQGKYSKKGPDIRLILIGLIVVLVILLIVVICIAANGKKTEPTEPTGTTTQMPEPSSSEPTVPSSSTAPYTPAGLEVLYPTKGHTITLENSFTFLGTSDPSVNLTINGQLVSRDEDGNFSHTVKLNNGNNTFEVAYNGETVTYTAEYRYVVEYFSPSDAQTYGSGATVFFEVSARTGSTVTATFNGTTTTLEKGENQSGFGAAEGFTIYVGTYTLTNINTTDLELGQITFAATYNGVTETYASGNITCQKSGQVLGSDPSVTPSTGGYQDVGSGYIGEVINYSAETFYYWDNYGYSHPVNNYLPEGTLDYVNTDILVSDNGKQTFRIMRCGYRVYTKKDNDPSRVKTPVLNCYIGTLPDHNEIGFVSMKDEGQYSVMTLDVLWKAPFRLLLETQDYRNPNGGGGRSYLVSAFTSSYIDITFCYATVFTGDLVIPADNPLFSHATLTQNESDCTLRLHFKEAGAFYGWDANYNDKGQLCFTFLNPPKVSKSDNAYGVDLTGIKIMLDVGHGGSDPGASGYTSSGIYYSEAERNLNLALLLKAELEKMGATVLLNREDNSTRTVDERILMMRGANVDLLIAVHHNSSSDTTSRGFDSFYYSPFSHVVTHKVNNAMKATGIYTSCDVGWHMYYMGRQTYCPVVLTENGFMKNTADMDAIADQATNVKKAQAIARGIADYYLLFAE